jgi:hypothetical protein
MSLLRIMVKDMMLSIKHSLRVTDTFTVKVHKYSKVTYQGNIDLSFISGMKVEPGEGILTVPLQGNTTFTCKGKLDSYIITHHLLSL